MKAGYFLVVSSLALTACVSSEDWKSLPTGEAAYRTIPASVPLDARPEYRINPQDKLNITVFREPDMSVKEAPVETGGTLVLPLIGRVRAAGQTTTQLANEIQSLLGAKYLVDPRVSVIVAESLAQSVTVDGAVGIPGSYGLQGDTTLLQAIALARGATKIATFDKVAVFRTVNGQRQGALFNLGDMRSGLAADPVLQSGDYVVVGTSSIKSISYDLLSLAPAAALFIPLVR